MLVFFFTLPWKKYENHAKAKSASKKVAGLIRCDNHFLHFDRLIMTQHSESDDYPDIVLKSSHKKCIRKITWKTAENKN